MPEESLYQRVCDFLKLEQEFRRAEQQGDRYGNREALEALECKLSSARNGIPELISKDDLIRYHQEAAQSSTAYDELEKECKSLREDLERLEKERGELEKAKDEADDKHEREIERAEKSYKEKLGVFGEGLLALVAEHYTPSVASSLSRQIREAIKRSKV